MPATRIAGGPATGQAVNVTTTPVSDPLFTIAVLELRNERLLAMLAESEVDLFHARAELRALRGDDGEG